MEIPSNKKNLDEISFIRPILIVMLVMYHAFAPWAGGWKEPEGFVPCEAYWWWGKLNYSFMLETFVMISGYVFGYQLITNSARGGKSLITSKLRRLIIPSILFSALYFVLFKEYESIGKTTYALLNGVGHMWFLPMLFWCFIAAYYLHKVAVPDNSKLAALACLAVISFLPLPLRLGNTLYYLFFFYLGIVLFKKKEQISNKVTPNIIGVLWIVFLALFVTGSLTNRSLLELHYDMLVQRLLTYSGINIIKLSYSTMGTLAIFCTALHFTRSHQLPKQVIEAGKLCFGTYLFQQFVLQLLYYRTTLFNHVYMAPWIGFIVALASSVLLTWTIRKTKIGRSLI